MSRINKKFKQLGEKKHKALIPFITAGDPSLHHTVSIMHELVAAGCDIIELGIPFSDPMADGPTIQRASERALKNGVSIQDVFSCVQKFRASDAETPVVLMGYGNPIESMGYAQFSETSSRVGDDGVIVVDLPPEESRDLTKQLIHFGIDSIFLIAPTSTEQRIKEIAKVATGYVYYVSLKGVTGAGHIDVSAVSNRIRDIRTHIKIPIGVGFGIRDGATAHAIAKVSDGVVIGSKIVETIEKSKEDEVGKKLFDFVSAVRKTMNEG